MSSAAQLDPAQLLRMLDTSRKLATRFDLRELLGDIVDDGRQVLNVDRGSVFLFDPDRRELYTTVATGQETIRFGIDKGIAGETARTRQVILVPDCYADPRFNREVDRKTGYVTKALLSLPLIDAEDHLVGVLQWLNPAKGRFDPIDIHLAQVLAAQAASAIQRALLVQAQLIKVKLEHDINLAKQIQGNLLPRKLPACPGYSLAVFNRPADDTGGDIYDVVPLGAMARGMFPGIPLGGDVFDILPAPPSPSPSPTPSPSVTPCPPARAESRALGPDSVTSSQAPMTPCPSGPDSTGNPARLLLVLADATGHGIGPALLVTQFRAMIRMGLRLTAGLDALVGHINNQLHQDLPENRFVTAFLGVLDTGRHQMEFHAAGQGPTLHHHAARPAGEDCDWLDATMPPLAVVPDMEIAPAVTLDLLPGDTVLLLTDGFYEYQNPQGRQYGKDRAAQVVRRLPHAGAQELLEALLEDLRDFAAGAPQGDDLTAIIVKRDR